MSDSDSVHSDWSDWEEDDVEEGAAHCLFSDARFPTVEEALAHDAQSTGFDLAGFRTQRRMDLYETIQFINFLRKQGPEGAAALVRSLPGEPTGTAPWQQDEHLVPALEADALLSHDWEEDEEAEANAGLDPAALEEQRRRVEELLRADDPSIVEELQQLAASGAEPGREAGRSAVSTAEAAQNKDDVDDAYFDSYSSFEIHHQMLSDKPRTEAYRQALENNPSLIAGKTVVDVGCGTGILSMFAARGGAARVVGVEASAAMAGVARANVSANALGERVRVVHARAEALTAADLPAGGADVLVSEWMGYALLFEAMLDAVLLVRDRFLRPGGAILPDLLAVHAAGAGDAAAGLDYWRDVYGFRMPAVAAKAADAAEREALVRVVSADCLVTAPVVAQTLDLATMAPEDQDFTADLTLTAAEGKDAKILSCIVLWFDAQFSERFCRDAPVTLDTSPAATPTHWAQTVLKLREPVDLGRPGVKGLHVRLTMTRSKDKHRQLDIILQTAEWTEGGKQDRARLLSSTAARTQLFSMAVKG